MAKSNPLPVDAEKDEKKGYGGVSAKEILQTAGYVQSAKEKSSKIAGDVGAQLSLFEDKGGNKKALKFAQMLNGMEIENGAEFWRAVDAYLDVMGFFDKLELFDQNRKNELNKESIAQASSAPKAGNAPAAAATH